MKKEQTDRMVLYLDIDHVVLGKNDQGEIALIPNFKAILSYLRENYECRWVTTHGKYAADDVIRYGIDQIGCYGGQIQKLTEKSRQPFVIQEPRLNDIGVYSPAKDPLSLQGQLELVLCYQTCFD